MCAFRRYALFRDIGLLVAVVAVSAAQGSASKSAASANRAAADQKDFDVVCGACHNTSLISDFRTEPEWEETVEHMVSIGADGGADQLKAVMRVLLRTWTKVNVNTATAAQLPLVLDISEAMAERLVKYRKAHGNFKSFEDLKKVPGINSTKLDARRNRIAF